MACDWWLNLGCTVECSAFTLKTHHQNRFVSTWAISIFLFAFLFAFRTTLCNNLWSCLWYKRRQKLMLFPFRMLCCTYSTLDAHINTLNCALIWNLFHSTHAIPNTLFSSCVCLCVWFYFFFISFHSKQVFFPDSIVVCVSRVYPVPMYA